MCSVQTTKRFANEAWDSQYYLLLKRNKANTELTMWHHCQKKNQQQKNAKQMGEKQKKTTNILLTKMKTLPSCCYFNINLLWQERQRKVRQLGETITAPCVPTAPGTISHCQWTHQHCCSNQATYGWRSGRRRVKVSSPKCLSVTY